MPMISSCYRERDKLTAMTDSHPCHKPISQVIEELNRQLKGWGNYSGFSEEPDAGNLHVRFDQGTASRGFSFVTRRPTLPFIGG